MRYPLLMLIALCLIPANYAGAVGNEPYIPGQAADYKAVRDLQALAGSSGPSLPAEGAPKAELLLALAETATRAAEGQAASLKSRDYDALYALLQKYRDDLKGLGLKQGDLENQLVALKLKEQQLEDKVNSLSQFALDGLKIFGRQTFTYDDLLLTGPGGAKPDFNPGNAARYRTASLETDLFFTATRGPVSGLAELNYKSFLGTQWPNYNYFGVRQVQAELRTPIVAQVGDLNLQWTPFTLWRNDDEDPFDVEPFTARKQRRLDDLTLKDHAVRIRGLRLLTDLALFGSQTVHLQGVFEGLGYASSIVYYTGTYPTAPLLSSPGTFPFFNTALINGDYNTYLTAWQADWAAAPAFDLAYSGTLIFDSPDSANANYDLNSRPAPGMQGNPVRGYSSQVHSGQLSSSIADGLIKLRLEGAESLYTNPNDPLLFNDPTLGASGYLTGTALMAEAALSTEVFQLKANWHQVSNTFMSAPAQGRSSDSSNSNYGSFLTESDRYNPQSGLFFDNYQGLPDSGESQLTRTFLPPQLKRAAVTATSLTPTKYFFNYLMPYNSALNAGSPYGYATPNRTGFGAQASLKLFNGGFQPLAFTDVSSQLTGLLAADPLPIETFSAYGAGGVIDLLPWLDWNLKLKGGWRSQAIADGANVSFNSSQYSAGLEWKHPTAALWYAGYKHIDYSGALGIPLYGAYQDPLNGSLLSATFAPLSGIFKYQQSFDAISVGVRYMITEASDIEANYTTQTEWDELANKAGIASHYELDQTFTKFSLRF